jgi:hypothetical protein
MRAAEPALFDTVGETIRTNQYETTVKIYADTDEEDNVHIIKTEGWVDGTAFPHGVTPIPVGVSIPICTREISPRSHSRIRTLTAID